MQLSPLQKNHHLFRAVREDDLTKTKHYIQCGATDIATAYGIACTQKRIKCEDYLKQLIIARSKWPT
jgi:hypothetical protein